MADPVASPATPWWRLPMTWMKGLYHWVLHWADTPYGAIALALLAFAESSFFPIPPDVLLIALVLGRREKWFRYAVICTVGSVLGGAFGWWLGHEFFGVVNGILAWLVGPESWYGRAGPGAEVVALSGYDFYRYLPEAGAEHHTSLFLKVKDLYDQNAFLAVFGAAFSPIPYKVFTVAGGYFAIPIETLLLASVIGRGMRFFAVAILLWLFGPPMKRFIDRYFDWLALAFLVLLVGGFVVLKKVI